MAFPRKAGYSACGIMASPYLLNEIAAGDSRLPGNVVWLTAKTAHYTALQSASAFLAPISFQLSKNAEVFKKATPNPLLEFITGLGPSDNAELRMQRRDENGFPSKGINLDINEACCGRIYQRGNADACDGADIRDTHKKSTEQGSVACGRETETRVFPPRLEVMQAPAIGVESESLVIGIHDPAAAVIAGPDNERFIDRKFTHAN